MALNYTLEIVINKPREEVAQKMADPKNMPHWQRGFISLEPMEGEPGKEGSTTKLNYKMGKREVEMIETILKNDLPREFNATFDANGVHNIQHNRFEEIDANTTKWVSESEFQFGNFVMKAMGWLAPGAFKKQSRKYIEDFKAFVEEGKKVSEDN